jgi:hypothetical protein
VAVAKRKDSDNARHCFPWDPTGQQWIFNISTKNAPMNVVKQTYVFQIFLNDGSSILLQFGLR